MRTRARLLSLLLFAVALLALASCGGDDPEDEQQSAQNATAVATATTTAAQSSGTPSGNTGSTSGTATRTPSGTARTIDLDCGRAFKSFRFAGELSISAPQDGSAGSGLASVIGSLLQNVKFTGAYVAPDRSQLKLDGGSGSPLGTIEFIQIGNTSHTRLGNAAWQQSESSGGPTDFVDQLDPREMCRQFQDSLSADVPSRKEQVNGVDATRYDYDRETLEKLGSVGGFLNAVGGTDEDLPENTKMSVWVSEKDKFPVKTQITASDTRDGETFSMNMELNVTDLNGNVSIEAPR